MLRILLITLLVSLICSCKEKENMGTKSQVVTELKNLKFRQSDQRAYLIDSIDLFTGDVIRHYPRGGLYSRTPFVNGLAHGIYKVYDSADRLLEKGMVVKGYKNGKLYQYFEDGSWTEYFCVNGLKQGEFNAYFQNGNLKGKGIYKDGHPEGDYVFYYKTGEVERIVYHSAGRISKSVTYYKSGSIKLEAEHSGSNFKHGNVISYYENGQMKERGNYNWNRKNGTFTTFDIEGSIISQILYNFGDVIKNKEEVTPDPLLTRLLAGDSCYDEKR